MSCVKPLECKEFGNLVSSHGSVFTLQKKKKKASEKKGSLSHPGSVISFMHDLGWEVMAEPCVILKVILVFSLGERWKGRGEMGGRERE